MAAKNANGIMSDVIILFWIRENPASGYDIRKMIESERVAPWVNVSYVTVYQSLRRLEEEGLVTGKGARLGNYPKKVVYAITRKGMQFHDTKVLEFLRDPEREGRAFRVGLSCMAYVPLEGAVAALEDRVAALQHKLAAVRHRLSIYPTLKGMPFPEWVHLVREQALLGAEIEWLKEFEDDYKRRHSRA